MATFSRRSMLAGAAAGPTLLQAQQQPPSQKRPNILFLLSDDQTWNDLGCMGNKVVRTPNIDKLAARGARFTNCYVTSPQCSPNRSSIFTGCSPHTTSTSRLHTPMPDWEPSILEPLEAAGYFTGCYRKHHQGASFQKRFDFYGSNQEKFEKFFEALPSGRPFWLQMGFTDPHRPYKPGAFTPPHDPARIAVPNFLPDDPEVRKDLGHYYDFIARMDADCGEVLAILEKRGLLDNTLVVMTGDNGMPFPRAKGTCYDPGIRVPMVAAWPGKIKPGTVHDELIAHVDLAPTWLEAAGLPVPKKMQGRSFLPLLTGSGSYTKRAEIFSERNWHDNFDPIRSVRTERYKLIFNAAPHFPYRPAWDLADSPTWDAIQRLGRRGRLSGAHARMLEPDRPMLELYDLQTDPDEFNNLATSAAHAQILADLTKRLSAWMQATYDFLPPGTRGWSVSL